MKKSSFKILKCAIKQCGGRCLAADEKGCRIDSPKIKGLGKKLIQQSKTKGKPVGNLETVNSKRFKLSGPTKKANENLLQAVKSRDPKKIGQALLEWFKSLGKTSQKSGPSSESSKFTGLSPEVKSQKIRELNEQGNKAKYFQDETKKLQDQVSKMGFLNKPQADIDEKKKELAEMQAKAREATTIAKQKSEELLDSLKKKTRTEAAKILEANGLKVSDNHIEDVLSYIQTAGSLPPTLKIFIGNSNIGRSEADSVKGSVEIGKGIGRDIVWHEIAHHTEFSDEKVFKLAETWRNAKSIDRQVYYLSDLDPAGDYEKHEYGMKGNYQHPYVSKVYPRQNFSEVVSWGFEQMSNPVAFAKFVREAPDHAELMINKILPLL